MSARFPLLLVLAAACSGATNEEVVPTQAVTLTFAGVVGSEPAACGVSYDLGGVTAELADARLFVSEVALRVDGEWSPVTLDDTDWQQADLALLDFEDGTAGCADSGTAETNDTLTGAVAEGSTIDGIRLSVGIPFASNHLDSATAPAPLNTPGMFWTWQAGYKFVRIDWMVEGAERWNVHLGSTGCVSDAPTKAPAEACSAPNRAIVELNVDPTAEAVTIDLAELVAGADLAFNVVDSPPGCMSSPTEGDDCEPVFANLGLDFATGECVSDCTDQGVFR